MEKAGEQAGESQWYCLRAKVKREHFAAAFLRARAGYEVIAPRLAYVKNTRRGKVRFVEALFPGYLFCRFDLQNDLRRVLGMQGVTGVVHYGHHYPAVSPDFIVELRQRMPQEVAEVPDPEIAPGIEMVVTEGPFRELVALVSRVLPARQRVAVLLDILGRSVEIEMPRELLTHRDKPSRKTPLDLPGPETAARNVRPGGARPK